MEALNLPNALTILRIVMIPLFVTSVIYERYDFSLTLFVVAALTDTFDGLIARRRNQKTALGNILDPIADKFLLITSFILFSIYGLVPKWLTITIISRDVIVVTGWVIIFIVSHRTKVEPTVAGKTAIALQLVLIGYVLLDLNLPFLPDLQEPLSWAAAVLTAVSGLHYIYRGLTRTDA